MITRIVKLTIQYEKTAEFIALFNESKSLIKNSPGCRHVELLNDIHQPTIFFTHSHWDSEEHLNQYRDSDLFKNIWPKTKILFADKPEAWSLQSFAE
jgi:heme-degrading monooxygenase HmoA